MTLKIAVFAPMPKASVKTGYRREPGSFRQNPDTIAEVLNGVVD